MSKKSSRSSRPRKSATGPKNFRPDKPKHWQIVNGKPTAEPFPLTPMSNGAWAKKVKGKLEYYGSWATRVDGKLVQKPGDSWWRDALALYENPTPETAHGPITIRDLCNRFLTAKKRRLDSGDMTARSFVEFHDTCDRLMTVFGRNQIVEQLGSDDFNRLLDAIRKGVHQPIGLVRRGNEINRARSVFKFAHDNGLIGKAIAFGSEFEKPDESELRKARAKNGSRKLTAEECRKLIDAADVPIKAMLLLGLNAGFCNHDCATLPLEAVDLAGGWIEYARPKTGIPRRCPLWVETVEALRQTLANRPQPQEAAQDLVFVRPGGQRWLTDVHTTVKIEGKDIELVQPIACPVAAAVGSLMKSAGVHRKGLGFYTLRHCFRSAAGPAKDREAIDRVMGHGNPTMAGRYIEWIDDSRLRAVADAVHTWLFAEVK